MSYQIERLNTDVVIIGGGLAGCMAAIKASEYNISVTILEKANVKRSGCAGSGIDHLWSYIPPVHEKMGWTIDDLIEDHSQSRGYGGFLRKDILRLIASNMYDRMLELESFGLKFRFPDSKAPGNFRLVYQFHSVPSSFNFEGRDIKRVLAQRAKEKGVNIINRVMALELMVDQGQVYGVIGISTREPKIYEIYAKAVILSASGRINRLSKSFVGNNFNRRNPPSGSTGDSKAMFFEAGGELINMEFMGERHLLFRNFPMGGGAPYSTLQPCARLVTAGGEVIAPRMQFYDWEKGNKITDKEKHREEFVSKLLQRQKASQRALEILNNAGGPLYLDCAEGTDEEIAYVKWSMSNEGKMWLLNKFLDDNDVDLKNDKLEFGLGDVEMSGSSSAGAWVDNNCQSCIKELYVAGDEIGGVPWACGPGAIVTGWYTGKIAGEKSLEIEPHEANNIDYREKVKARINDILNRKKGEHWKEIECALQDIMDATFFDGQLTSDALLLRGLHQVEELIDSSQLTADNPHELMRCLEVQNLMKCARIILKAAYERKESRALLKKKDFPEQNDKEWFVFLAAKKGEKGEIHFTKKPVVNTTAKS